MAIGCNSFINYKHNPCHFFRFTKVRDSLQGKLEERLPFISLIFPSSFQSKYNEAFSKLKANVDRLTTPLDIHSTLMDILHLNKSPMSLSHPKNGTHRLAQSLFTSISSKRTCQVLINIWLPQHWEGFIRKHGACFLLWYRVIVYDLRGN